MSHPGSHYSASARGGSVYQPKFWWDASMDELARRVFENCAEIESQQWEIYDRFLRYACLYDPHERMGLGNVGLDSMYGRIADSFVADNVCQNAVDTAASIISKNRPRIAVNTDGGNWSTQRRAKWLERWLEGYFRMTDFYAKAQEAFVDACVLGTGVLKIMPKPGGGVSLERVLIDEIIVDERACRGKLPRFLHQRTFTDREELAALYPEYEAEIMDGSADDRVSVAGFWADYRPIELGHVVVVESWRLPRRGPTGALTKGRHVKCIPGCVLLDEEWTFDEFPFLFYRWAERRTGFYGRGVVEELAGRQRHINRMNWQFDRRLQQLAVPRWMVHIPDAAMQVRLVNGVGAVLPYTSKEPKVVTAQPVTDAEWMRLGSIVAGGLSQVGISALSARSAKPAGVESAVAMRELTDTEAERFARNVQRWEGLHVGGAMWGIRWAKKADNNAPEVAWKAKSLTKLIKWSKVDLGDEPFALGLDAAGAIARTPAGRMQRVIELAQSGLIGNDEARRLLEHPDLQRAMSLANAAIEAAEHEIELMLEGESRVPETYLNLELTIGRVQQEYLIIRADGAPEEILELFRDFIEFGIEQLKMKQQPTGAMPGGPPGPPGMGPGPMPGPPGLPPGPPGPLPPQAALAASAMNLQAA